MHVFGNYWLGELKDRDPQAISAGQHGPRPRFLPHGHQLISASAISIQLHVLILISIQLHLLILISIHLHVLIFISIQFHVLILTSIQLHCNGYVFVPGPHQNQLQVF